MVVPVRVGEEVPGEGGKQARLLLSLRLGLLADGFEIVTGDGETRQVSLENLYQRGVIKYVFVFFYSRQTSPSIVWITSDSGVYVCLHFIGRAGRKNCPSWGTCRAGGGGDCSITSEGGNKKEIRAKM